MRNISMKTSLARSRACAELIVIPKMIGVISTSKMIQTAIMNNKVKHSNALEMMI